MGNKRENLGMKRNRATQIPLTPRVGADNCKLSAGKRFRKSDD